jgi:hypothetical protein
MEDQVSENAEIDGFVPCVTPQTQALYPQLRSTVWSSLNVVKREVL